MYGYSLKNKNNTNSHKPIFQPEKWNTIRILQSSYVAFLNLAPLSLACSQSKHIMTFALIIPFPVFCIYHTYVY